MLQGMLWGHMINDAGWVGNLQESLFFSAIEKDVKVMQGLMKTTSI